MTERQELLLVLPWLRLDVLVVSASGCAGRADKWVLAAARLNTREALAEGWAAAAAGLRGGGQA